MEQVLAKLDAIASRLDRLEAKVGGGGPAAPAGGAGAEGGEAPSVAAFQELVDQHLGQWVELSTKIGGDVAAVAPLAMACVSASKALIAEAAKSKKPSDADLPNILKPLSEAIGAVSAFQSKSRSAKDKNNVFGIGEGIGIFGWVTVTPAPGPYAAEMVGTARFYLDKVLREFKGKDETQTTWTNAWIEFLNGLVTYIKKHHTTGLSWNPRGGDAKAPAVGAAPAAAAPKPAASPVAAPAAAAAPAKAGPGLFAELNKGGAITGGLKKVERKDTNKDKQISGKVEAKETKPVPKAGAKPAKVELNGNKWTVEYQVHPAAPVVLKGVEKNHSVCVYKCEGAVIQIEGKLNSVFMDGCKKTGLVFDELVSTCEVVNCSSVQVQVKHKCPAIAIDKTAGIQIYLPATSLETEIVSGTSSEMNVQIPHPSGKEDADPIEMPIPEQFKSVIKDGKLISAQVDHSGG